ncbi:hypothetical protein SUGI_0125890 [Cryptomeria japonica]|nr:hypothetical protein SUGI_0125890 [Cryptomeria japonica]
MFLLYCSPIFAKFQSCSMAHYLIFALQFRSISCKIFLLSNLQSAQDFHRPEESPWPPTENIRIGAGTAMETGASEIRSHDLIFSLFKPRIDEMRSSSCKVRVISI